MSSVLQDIGVFLGERFKRVEGLFATKMSVDEHVGNKGIHRTSAEIRAEIVDGDIPDSITRDVELRAHDEGGESHPDIRGRVHGIESGSTVVKRSEFAERLGSPEDSYTKVQLDKKINKHVKDVEYDGAAGIFTFTFEDGTVTVVDTPIEGAVKDGRYDSVTSELVLVLVSGEEVRIPAAGLVKVYSGKETTTTTTTVGSDGRVGVDLRQGVVDSVHLSEALLAAMSEFQTKTGDTGRSVVTFETAESLKNVVSGEDQRTLWGKVARWIGDFMLHKADNERHKTEGDRGKLGNLADDANGTYATKEELSEAVPVVLRATGVLGSTGMVKYTLDAESIAIMQDVLFGGRSLIGAILCGSYADSGSYVCETSFVCTYSEVVDGRILEVRFSRVESEAAYSLYFRVLTANGHVTGTPGGGLESIIEYGKYLPDKYGFYETGSYDMNKFKLSGGIFVQTSDTVIVDNLPTGFTSVTGYCLSNIDGCTQVITDTNLDQTAMRTYGYVDQADGTSAMVWSPWKRIDYKQEVYVVAEYPTDLTGYADGSIFIKNG